MFLWQCTVSKAWRKNTNKMQQYKWFIVNSRQFFLYYIFAFWIWYLFLRNAGKTCQYFSKTKLRERASLFYYTFQIFLLQREIKSPNKHWRVIGSIWEIRPTRAYTVMYMYCITNKVACYMFGHLLWASSGKCSLKDCSVPVTLRRP